MPLRALPSGLGALLLAGAVALSAPAAAEEPQKAVLRGPVVANYEQMAAERRLALVIAESAYTNAAPLPGASHDAALVQETLRRANFDVTVREDLTKRELEREILAFVGRVRPGDVVLVYYSGHGIQRAGQNWLIPFDADLVEPGRLESDGVSADWMFQKLGTAPGRLNMVLLDACRNNPWAKSWAATAKSLPAQGGLAPPPKLPTGFVISYATAPETTAADGGTREGPYARAFASAAARPDDLNEVFQNVHADVRAETRGSQEPWISMGMGPGRFYFTLPSESRWRRMFGEETFGSLTIDVGRAGEVTVDGERLATGAPGSTLTPRVLSGRRTVRLAAECQEVDVPADGVASVVFAAPAGSEVGVRPVAATELLTLGDVERERAELAARGRALRAAEEKKRQAQARERYGSDTRAGAWVVEASFSFAGGAVNRIRIQDTRWHIEDDGSCGEGSTFVHDGLGVAPSDSVLSAGPGAQLRLGFTPWRRLETSLATRMQQSTPYHFVDAACVDGELVEDPLGDTSEVFESDFYMELAPTVRFFVVPSGAVEVWVSAAGIVTLLPEMVELLPTEPTAEAQLSLGAEIGVGIARDVSPNTAVFAELYATAHLYAPTRTWNTAGESWAASPSTRDVVYGGRIGVQFLGKPR